MQGEINCNWRSKMGVTWKVLRTLATFETQLAKMIKIMNGWDNVR